jgi:glucokinase
MVNKNLYIGIDIGGTKINIAVINKNGDILFKETIKTSENLDEKILLQNITAIVEDIKSKYPNVCGIGIGSAGIILYKEGIIKFSPNIGWKDFAIVSELEKMTNLSVILDNDANAAAWGTFYLKYSETYKNMMCVTLGTGIGGGLILNGEIFRGFDGTAGEIGHMTYIPDGLACSCGNNGCIERYAGTKGIIELAENYLKENKWQNSIIPKFVNELGKITPKSIEDAAINHDELAIHIWKEVGVMLGTVFASILNLLNIEAIHVTGGIAHAQKWIEKDVIETINNRAFSIPAKTVKIIFEKQNHDMGVIGAGLLVLAKYNKDQESSK